MTPEEFQKWIGGSKLKTTIEFLSDIDNKYNLKRAWENIEVGKEYWFFNLNTIKGPADWMKMEVTYKRSGVYFYKVHDNRYKFGECEEYTDIQSLFTRTLHPAIFKNPNPEYFKPENFDTLDGRIKII